MRAARFSHLVGSGCQLLLATLSSVIVEGASDRHHFIDHTFSPAAKFVSQNSQSFHRREGMFHSDTFTVYGQNIPPSLLRGLRPYSRDHCFKPAENGVDSTHFVSRADVIVGLPLWAQLPKNLQKEEVAEHFHPSQ